MKKAIVYGFFLLLGSSYLMLFAAELKWPEPMLFSAIAAFGLLLASVAWWARRRGPMASQLSPTHVGLILSALGLMVAVAGSAVEAEYIVKGEARWWVALMWLAAIAVILLLAGRYRKVIVAPVFRGIAALLAIGAIVHRTQAEFLAATVSSLTLFLFAHLWTKRARRA